MMIRKIGTISRTYRHMERYVEILSILFRYGFGDLISSLKIEQYLDLGRRVFSGKDRERLDTLSRPERLRMALEELGPTFIKLGQVRKERLHPRRLAEDLIGYSSQILRLAKTLPGDIQATLKLARQGRLKIGFEHKGLEPLLTTLDRTSNRLAFAVVIAALIIGSSLVIHADIPPKWHDVPLIGLAGYLVAGVMGFWLLVSILRRGRM